MGQTGKVMKKIAVAVGDIERKNGDILIAKRHQHLHQGGKWEFPGGKVEQDETTLMALSRELEEEVGLVIAGGSPMLLIEHDYGDKIVVLDIWKVNNFTGEGRGNEGQQVKWVAKNDLVNYQFPDANSAIIEKILAL